ncbi:MAG: glycosyltransferase family 2 protein [Lachnospiraceae bacterium]|nr:glycosyltransferase family 2 protein [Lachnospiraceae bacterium]
MTGYLKELIKAPILRRLYTEYFYELENSFISYDDYYKMIKSALMESVSVSEDEANRLCSVRSYNDTKDLKVDEISSEYIIFVNDISGMDKDAKRIVVHHFLSDPSANIIYSDEDEFNSNETVLMNPWFKPDWSPDTLIDHMYFGNMVAFRTDLLKKAGQWENIYELTLKLALSTKKREIVHIRAALYHSHFLKKLFDKRQWDGLRTKVIEECHIRTCDTKKSLVSVIIPSKDNPKTLETCLRSLIRLTRDLFFEIIIVDNGSSQENKCKIEGLIDGLKQDLASCEYVENSVDKIDIRYLYRPQPFNFSRMCDQGAKDAKGDYLLFLNDDIEIREGHWMSKMLEVASRTHTGAVGAKLYYPNSMLIQHAGIANLRLGPVHKLQFKDDRTGCYMDLNNGVRNCIAVTGACMMIAKSKFDEVGGFCEELEIAFNDVDLCFRLYESGYHNAVCNNTHLWHYESLSRGSDSTDDKLVRLTAERDLLYKRHPALYGYDPYMSVHMSTDILDTNYSFIYQYDHRDVTTDVRFKPWNKKIKEKWKNECLSVSLEYAGSYDRFTDINAKSSTKSLISGYAYVMGSDNSCFIRSILLEGQKGSFIASTIPVFRPDLEINLDPEEYGAMCGFSLTFDLRELPDDEYRISVISRSRSSRLILYGQTNKFIRVNRLTKE